MKVREESIPQTEGIKSALPKVDFTDTFSTTNHQDTLEKVALLVFGTLPNWVKYLFVLRNYIVQFFGLKTEVPEDNNRGFKVGGHIGFFEIYSIQDNEIMLGANDKHLNFRVSIYNSNEAKYNIKVTTLVEYNNLFGKVYMLIVKPFHRPILKIMVKQAYKL